MRALDLGAFAKPVEQQLEEQGYRFKNDKQVELYSKLIKSFNMVRFHIATDGEADKMANRLIKKLKGDIEPIS